MAVLACSPIFGYRGACSALGNVLKRCSDDGCTVLAGGMLGRPVIVATVAVAAGEEVVVVVETVLVVVVVVVEVEVEVEVVVEK